MGRGTRSINLVSLGGVSNFGCSGIPPVYQGFMADKIPAPKEFMGVQLTWKEFHPGTGHWSNNDEGDVELYVSTSQRNMAIYGRMRPTPPPPWSATLTLRRRHGSMRGDGDQDHVEFRAFVDGETDIEALRKLEEVLRNRLQEARWLVDVMDRAASTGSLTL